MTPDTPTKEACEVLLTASEAYPRLESLFLAAKSEVLGGFRVFDPDTRLRSPAARAVGERWSDLITHTLERGVRISLALTDFDPVIRPDTHRYAWACLRGLQAAGAASCAPDRLQVRTVMHPARVGLLPRLALWPRLHKELKEVLAQVNQQSRDAQDDFLDQRPGLVPLVKRKGDRLVPRLAPPPLVPVTHHQKLAVIDREWLYIGGLDLNDRRYDTPAHEQAAEGTWHDTQVVIRGPAVAEAAQHLEEFEGVTQGQSPSRFAHLQRTISARRSFNLPYLSPRPVLSEISEAHHALIRETTRLIYFETQFFRDTALADALVKRADEVPDLGMILILPAAPEDAAFDADPSSDVAYGEHLQVRCVRTLREGFGPRLFIGTPARPSRSDRDGRGTHMGAPIVYLHAKVSVFDDHAAIVSSANLNGRSLAWDTEAGVTLRGRDDVVHLTRRCFDHWLGEGADATLYDPATAVAAWQARAEENAACAPELRNGFMLPYSVAPAAALARNLPGVPEEMV